MTAITVQSSVGPFTFEPVAQTKHFAIHPTVGYTGGNPYLHNTDLVTVTHKPTGLAVSYYLDQDEGRRLMDALEQMDIPWDSTEAETFRQYSYDIKRVMWEVTGGLMP